MANDPIGYPESNPAYHGAVRGLTRALRQRCGVGKGDRIVVAVSGGRDSVALLRGLAQIAPRRTWGLSLVVAHVQHHLRGEAAEGDAEFVRELAGRLGLPHERVDVNLSDTGNTESNARQARYAALAQLARANGAGFVATGHHAEDQLETLLMRLSRGASLRGLSGMGWRRQLRPGSEAKLIRPLLGTPRAELESYLRALGQPWREDGTNTAGDRARARLRRDVLPVLAELYPDAARKAVSAADRCREADRLVGDEVESAWSELAISDGPDRLTVDRSGLRELAPIVRRGLLRQLIRQAGAPADRLGRPLLDQLSVAVADRQGGERRFELAGGVTATLTRDRLTVFLTD